MKEKLFVYRIEAEGFAPAHAEALDILDALTAFYNTFPRNGPKPFGKVSAVCVGEGPVLRAEGGAK